jgi:hypothetical protein
LSLLWRARNADKVPSASLNYHRELLLAGNTPHQATYLTVEPDSYTPAEQVSGGTIMKRNLTLLAIVVGLMLMGAAFAQDSTTTTQQTTTSTTTSSDNSASTMPDSTPATQNGTLSDKDSATTPATEATPTGTQSNDSNVRTVTGCLAKGDSASEYQLTGRDGSTWELHSDAVDMASHVGHTVTVTGAVHNANLHGMKEDAKKEANEHGMGKSAEHGHMTVTNLSMVSNSCS